MGFWKRESASGDEGEESEAQFMKVVEWSLDSLKVGGEKIMVARVDVLQILALTPSVSSP